VPSSVNVVHDGLEDGLVHKPDQREDRLALADDSAERKRNDRRDGFVEDWYEAFADLSARHCEGWDVANKRISFPSPVLGEVFVQVYHVIVVNSVAHLGGGRKVRLASSQSPRCAQERGRVWRVFGRW
jgi:hypothetical protein